MGVPGQPVGEGYASRQLTTPRQPVTPHQLPTKAPPQATATNPRLPQPATVRPKPVVRTVLTAPRGVEVTRPTAPPVARFAAPLPVTPNVPAVVRPTVMARVPPRLAPTLRVPVQVAPRIPPTPRLQVRVRPNVAVRPAAPVAPPAIAPTPRLAVKVVAPRG